jgi:hypothetical protein
MPIRSFALKTAVLFALAVTFPAAHAATGIATNVVLTITTSSTLSYGEAVAGYAVVSASDGSQLSGTVTFFDGTANICTIPVTQTTSCPASAGTGFAVGTHLLTAAYSGDGTHLGSSSNIVPVVVIPDTTAVSLTSSANPAVYGQSMTFTANVAAAGQSLAPTGFVTFLDGNTRLGTAPLNGAGVASFSISSLNTGNHAISADYAGSSSAAASSSAPLTETVTAAPITGQGSFTVTVTGTATVVTGSAVNLLVTVAPRTGSIQPVQLSCTGLPSEAACTFGTATLPINGGTTSLQISTMAPHSCESTTPYSKNAGIPFTGPALAGLILLFLPQRKRRSLKGLLMLLIAACGIATLSGCGNCTDLGTKPGDYTIRIIGTSTGASASTVVAKVVLHVAIP